MKKRITLLLFLLILSIHASNINVQSAVEENNNQPTSLELTPHAPISITSDSGFLASSILINNTCKNSGGAGIYLVESEKIKIIDNTCHGNTEEGILIEYSSNECEIVNNNISNNLDEGISLYRSDGCLLYFNLLQENGGYGIRIYSDSDNNLIHNNNFVDNNLGGTSQAFDDGTSNNWYDLTYLEGNYWSDWIGTGNYSIDGSAVTVDLYPLDEPAVYVFRPDITSSIHSPSTPSELDTVSINATVTSPYGVQSVTLHYRVNGGAWIEFSMTLINGDIYSVTIGPFAVSDTIEYYISAIDNSVNHNEAIKDNGGAYYSLTIGSSDVTGPSVTDIVSSPSSPTELDPVSINATVTDDSGVQSVILHYRVNSGAWTEVSMTLISSNIYSVTIGSFAVSNTIEYYITAVDNSVNHNLAINDNSGLYYSFTIAEGIPEFQTFSLLLPAIAFLFLICGLVVQQRRKRE